MFHVRPALSEDIDSGHVWLTLDDALSGGQIYRIKAMDTDKTIFRQLRAMDQNFLDYYDRVKITGRWLSPIERRPSLQPPHRVQLDGNGIGLILLPERDRLKLSLSKDEFCELEVILADAWWGRLRACWEHPQIPIAFSVQIGLLGVLVGLIGAAFGVLGIIMAAKGVSVSFPSGH